MILSRESIHTWKVVDSLVWFHFLQLIARDRTILPAYIPILFIITSELHFIDLLTYVADYIIFRLDDVHDEPLFMSGPSPFLFSPRSSIIINVVGSLNGHWSGRLFLFGESFYLDAFLWLFSPLASSFRLGFDFGVFCFFWLGIRYEASNDIAIIEVNVVVV